LVLADLLREGKKVNLTSLLPPLLSQAREATLPAPEET
jgi:hypothetical protein